MLLLTIQAPYLETLTMQPPYMLPPTMPHYILLPTMPPYILPNIMLWPLFIMLPSLSQYLTTHI